MRFPLTKFCSSALYWDGKRLRESVLGSKENFAHLASTSFFIRIEADCLIPNGMLSSIVIRNKTDKKPG